MPAAERTEYLRALDEPRHALIEANPGGINGAATIQGVPTGSPGSSHFHVKHERLGVQMEPIAVLMRDAVTIDTAVRLLGIGRDTIQNGCAQGRLPALKLGPGKAPWMVRLRDVLLYVVTMYAGTRKKLNYLDGGEGEIPTYIGFPEWLVREVSESWPESIPFAPGKWEPREIKINRGGRPRGFSPGKGYSTTTGKKLGRPPGSKADTMMSPKPRPAPADAPPGGLPPAAPAAGDGPDAATLPKWHPQWRRPGT